MMRKTFLLLVASCLLIVTLFTLCGCEAFRRKFVRKPKHEKEVEVVVRTQEYESEYTAEEIYKKYYRFWRAAHDELVSLLAAPETNRKRLVYMARNIIDYLRQMRPLLKAEKQERLDEFILEQEDIIAMVDSYKLSSTEKLHIRNRLQRQRKRMEQEFSCEVIQEYLKER